MNIKKLFRRIRKTIKLLPYKGAGVALFKKMNGEYQLLLGKRKYRPQAGKWSIPGGGYESYDKTLLNTALRETQEEIGVDVLKAAIIKEPVEYRCNLIFFVWATYMYEVDSDFPVPKRFHEFSEMKFIPLQELGKYKLAWGVKKEIKKFLKETAKSHKRMETLTLLRKTDTKLPVNLWISETDCSNHPWLYFQNNYVDRFTCNMNLIPVTVEEHPKIIIKKQPLLLSLADYKKVTDFISNNCETIIKYIQDPTFGIMDFYENVKWQ